MEIEKDRVIEQGQEVRFREKGIYRKKQRFSMIEKNEKRERKREKILAQE